MIKVLLVEDDPVIAALLKDFLTQNSLQVSHVENIKSTLPHLDEYPTDIIVMDIGLPDGDGLELCRTIRRQNRIPIIMSTARGALDDKLSALQDGADDYLAKPYDPRELLARIYAVLKRTQPDKALSTRPFALDEAGRCITMDGQPLELTRAEYEILRLFLLHPGQVIPREDIANSIDAHRFESGVESINVLISRLRKKIETGSHRYIQTLRGIGYRFVLA